MTQKQMKQMKIMVIALAVVLVALAGVLIYNHIQSAKEEAQTEAAVLYEVEYDDIATVSFTSTDGETLTLVHESGDASGDASSDAESSDAESSDADSEYWTCAEYPDADLSYDSVYSLVYSLETVSYSEIVEDAQELSEYGLETPSNTITITTTDGTEYVLTVGDANAVTSEYYALFGSDNSVIYTIDSTAPTAVSVSLTDLLEDESADE